MKRLAPTLVIAACIVAFGVPTFVGAQTEGVAVPTVDDHAALSVRVGELEQRVASLEGDTTTTEVPTTTEAPTATVEPTTTTEATTTTAPGCEATINVPADGTDVSAAIASQINALPDGATARFAPGEYRVESAVVIKGVDNLTVDGCGATFYKNTDNGARIWQFTEQAGLTVKNMTIRGPHADASPTSTFVGQYEGGHGVALIGVTGAHLENLTIREVYGDGVNVRHNGGTGTRTTDVEMVGLNILSAGRQGVAITNADDVLIHHSYIGGCRLKCWDVEPNEGGVVRRATLRDSIIGPSGSFAVGANGRDGSTIEGAYVLDNVFEVDMRWGFAGNPQASLNDFRIEGNFAERTARECFDNAKNETVCGRDVLLLNNVNGLVVSDNHQPLPGGIDFFNPGGNTNVTADGNTH